MQEVIKKLIPLLVLFSQQVWGSTRSPGFPEPPIVREQMRFWTHVFTRVDSRSFLIHDAAFPNLIIDKLEYSALAKTYGKNGLRTHRDREKLARKYIQRYELAAQRFAKQGRSALKFGEIEKRMFEVYAREPLGMKALLKGEVELRAQGGLSDQFYQAAERAAPYILEMEKIFEQRGLSPDLTRISFVESMFNTSAISKVGASGVWQFMPSTAKLYMTVNPFVDERISPLKATRAAAGLLSDNYSVLKSWPLAITAYNHGAMGLKRAIRALGTDDIGSIIESHQSRSFGFASRNFYAEFLVARNVYNTKFRRHVPTRLDVSDRLSSVRIRKPLTLRQLAHITKFPVEEIIAHNACLRERGVRHYTSQPLPIGFELFLPSNPAKLNRIAATRLVAVKGVSL